MNAFYSTHLSSYVLGQNIIGIPKNNKRYKFGYKIVFFPILQSKLFNIPSFAFAWNGKETSELAASSYTKIFR